MVSHDTRPMKRNDAPPAALWMIAFAALAPFPLAAVAYGWGSADVARPALTVIITWSAVILAFLGGARWGLESALEKPRWQRLLISVLSPVLARCMLLARGRIDNPRLIGGCLGHFYQWLLITTGLTSARYPAVDCLTAAACVSLSKVPRRAIKTLPKSVGAEDQAGPE